MARRPSPCLAAFLVWIAAVPGVMTAGSVQGSPSDPSDLGSIGPSWSIAEADLLEVMLDRVRTAEQNGEVDDLRRQLREGASSYADRPPSLRLPRATQERRTTQDPSVVVPYAITDAQGRTLWAPGTRVNPLRTLALTRTLVFLDASDAQQVAWLRRRIARGEGGSDRCILTGGSPISLGRELKMAVYFDQQGFLVHRFGIAAVPATVAADPAAPRERLLVREIDPRRDLP